MNVLAINSGSRQSAIEFYDVEIDGRLTQEVRIGELTVVSGISVAFGIDRPSLDDARELFARWWSSQSGKAALRSSFASLGLVPSDTEDLVYAVIENARTIAKLHRKCFLDVRLRIKVPLPAGTNRSDELLAKALASLARKRSFRRGDFEEGDSFSVSIGDGRPKATVVVIANTLEEES